MTRVDPNYTRNPDSLQAVHLNLSSVLNLWYARIINIAPGIVTHPGYDFKIQTHC